MDFAAQRMRSQFDGSNDTENFGNEGVETDFGERYLKRRSGGSRAAFKSKTAHSKTARQGAQIAVAAQKSITGCQSHVDILVDGWWYHTRRIFFRSMRHA